ncbi:Transient receptor potential cation channel subfamily M member 1 [Strongyloides ratti]|uniref:Transient receptor potential cation channel subfamily M member 1 n=1 Tax=Strongyloides ratti TaxID=34506 RepID=A0A090MXK9_STRRB|nr:Transient receptor potential cation channel subfamily M member 1 [Strongyloides ratti]CEF65614.1 Transient receptor potential cation channel subfamily M member 1 [Strongyloides ratti]
MSEDTIHHITTLNTSENESHNNLFSSTFGVCSNGPDDTVNSYHRNNKNKKKYQFIEKDSMINELDEKIQNCWIEKTFKIRECIKFIPSSNEKDKCCCGNYSSFHSHKALSRFTTAVINKKYPKSVNNKKWNILEHTECKSTDSYGTIEFQGGNHAHKAYYCRVGFDSNPKDILYLMENIWKLETPNLVITIHGGMTNFEVQQKLGKVFREGLLKAAQTTGAWIITSGIDSGVVRHVARALDDAGISARMRSKIILLGIAPYGLLSNREKFIGKNIVIPLDHQPYSVRNNYTMLNDRHSYFLLVDNGTVGRYGADMVLRKRFENYLSLPNNLFYPAKRIPIICVILEGGICTLESALQYVTSKPPCPVIVCDGSGRISDLLSFAQKNLLQNGLLSPPVRNDLEILIKKIFNADSNTAHQILNTIMKCVNQKDLGVKDVDYTILTAILRGQNLSPIDQLYLTLSWNRVDIARSHIFAKNKEFNSNVLYSTLMDALLLERVDFVKLLFENGVNLSKFLTVSRLETLYNFDKQEILSLLQFLIGTQAESKRYKNLTLFDIGIIIEKLMGNAYRSNYTTRRYKSKNGISNKNKNNLFSSSNSKVGSLILSSGNCSTNSIYFNGKNETLKETDFGGRNNYIQHESTESKEEVDFSFPLNELMIWVILTKRHELAKFLWQYGEEAMARSLIAIRLYKGMAKVASDDYTALEVSTILREHANDFKKLSLELLEHCYQQDDRQTKKMLTTQLPNWGHHTCLSLAFLANNKEFLAHPCCQILLAELWYGGLRFRSQSNIKVIAAVLFPPTILLLDFKSSAYNLPNNISIKKKDSQINENNHIINNYKNIDKNIRTTFSEDNEIEDENYFSFPSREHLNQKRRSVVSLTYNSLFPEGQCGWRRLLGKKEDSNEKDNKEIDQINSSNINQQTDYIYVDSSNLEKKIDDNQKLSLGDKFQHWIILLFYKFLLFYRAPITSFWIWAISFGVFLTTFTFVLLIEFPIEPTIYEWYIFVYVISITLEHIRKLLTLEGSSIIEKIRVFYNTTYWHILTSTAIMTYFIGFSFRLNKETIHTHGRIILSVNSVFWHMKLFDFLSVHPKIGPYITMAGKMVLNMSYIIVMLLVTLMAFGLSRQAITYPHEKFNWLLVRNIFYKPYFMLYGEVYAGEIDTCGDEGTNCVPGGWIPPIIMTIFLLVANILLINMLIAIFNNIFTITNAMSQQVWMFQRYSQVLEYQDTPIIPPPFTPLIHLYLIINTLIKWSVRKKKNITTSTDYKKVKNMMPFAIKIHMTKDELRRIHDFEEDCMDDLCRKKNSLVKKNCETDNDTYNENIEIMTGKIVELINDNQNLKNNLNKIQEDLKNIEENQQFIIQMVIQNREKRKNSEIQNDKEIDCKSTLDDIEDPDSENDEPFMRSRLPTYVGDKIPLKHYVLPQYTSITDGLSNKLRLREWHKLSLSRYSQIDDQLGNEANFDINVNEIKSSNFLSDMQDMMKINNDEDNLYFNPLCPKVSCHHSNPKNDNILTTVPLQSSTKKQFD